MKTTLLVLLLAVMASCAHSDVKSSEYAIKASHFEYKGHEYIMFLTPNAPSSRTGYVHNPDCKCYKKHE